MEAKKYAELSAMSDNTLISNALLQEEIDAAYYEGTITQEQMYDLERRIEASEES
jgi:hypothetical protein